LWLVKNGVPFDVAFSLDEITRAAWCIRFGQLDGRKFDWRAMEWEDS
jgi:hypothetical protein